MTDKILPYFRLKFSPPPIALTTHASSASERVEVYGPLLEPVLTKDFCLIFRSCKGGAALVVVEAGWWGARTRPFSICVEEKNESSLGFPLWGSTSSFLVHINDTEEGGRERREREGQCDLNRTAITTKRVHADANDTLFL